MDHRDISNTVESGFAFRDGGAAVNEMSSCSVVQFGA
jgi:hypothetical protein